MEFLACFSFGCARARARGRARGRGRGRARARARAHAHAQTHLIATALTSAGSKAGVEPTGLLEWVRALMDRFRPGSSPSGRAYFRGPGRDGLNGVAPQQPRRRGMLFLWLPMPMPMPMLRRISSATALTSAEIQGWSRGTSTTCWPTVMG